MKALRDVAQRVGQGQHRLLKKAGKEDSSLAAARSSEKGSLKELRGKYAASGDKNTIYVFSDDIIRRDVAMKKTGVMERVQRVHDWVQDPERFVVSEFPILLFQIRFQRRTGNIFHDDIRGPVFAEKVMHIILIW